MSEIKTFSLDITKLYKSPTKFSIKQIKNIINNLSKRKEIGNSSSSSHGQVSNDIKEIREQILISFQELLKTKMKVPILVNIRRKNGKGDSFDLYIGRSIYMGGWKLKQSKWHNPFKNTENNLENVLEKYKEHVLNSELINDIHELAGLCIGCWCHPNPCHGNVLIKLYKEYVIDGKEVGMKIEEV